MKTIQDVNKLIEEVKSSIEVSRRNLPKEELKKKESRLSKELDYLSQVKLLIEKGFSEENLNNWRSKIEAKILLIKTNEPTLRSCNNNLDLHSKRVKEHNEAYELPKLKQQLNNIDFILN